MNFSFGLVKMNAAGPGQALTFARYRVSYKGFEPDEDQVRAIRGHTFIT